MCDTEFTIDQGKLWMLQTRVGKRTAAAAFRIATQLVDERLITQDEAFGRSSDPEELKNIMATGAAAGVLPGHTAPPVAGRPMPSRS